MNSPPSFFGAPSNSTSTPEPVMTEVVVDRRVGLYRTEVAPGATDEAGLLHEFAADRRLGVLARIDHAARCLERGRRRAESELTDHDQLPVGVDGDAVHPVDRFQDQAFEALARLRVTELIEAGLEQDERIAVARALPFPVQMVEHLPTLMAQWP